MTPEEEEEIRTRFEGRFTHEAIEWYIEALKLLRISYEQERKLQEDLLFNQLTG